MEVYSDLAILSPKETAPKDEYGAISRKLFGKSGQYLGSVSLSRNNDIVKSLSANISPDTRRACEYLSDFVIYTDFAEEILRRIRDENAEIDYDLNSDDPLIHIYYLKKYTLIAKAYFNQEYLSFDFPSSDPLSGRSFEEIIAWCKRRIGVIQKIVPDRFIEDCFDADYEVYTDTFYHRKFWNEIPNDNATQIAFDAFSEFIEKAYRTNGSRLFELSLYDFNDECISFDTQKSAMDFIKKFDCCPYTLFKRENGVSIELFSA